MDSVAQRVIDSGIELADFDVLGLIPADAASMQVARSLLARGFSVFPVLPPRPGVAPGLPGDGKVPGIAWGQLRTRFPTKREIDSWFVTEMNIGVVTGAISGVVVIDADDRDAVRWSTRRLPYTPWQTKTAKAFHFWYRHPGVLVPNRARIETLDGKLALDVRGDGGFVIGPGSLHASGLRYLEAGDWNAPRERVPVFEPRWLARPSRPASWSPRRPTGRPTGSVIDRARRYLAVIPQPQIGSGSDTAVFSAASRLVRGFDLSPFDAEALLWEWAGGRPGWTREWVAKKVAHAQRYAAEPIGALR